MSKKSSYSYKGKSTNWGRVFRRTVSDVTDTIFKYKSTNNNAVPCFFNPAARLVIYTLIVLTLLFAGIGLYAWVTLGMLLLILRIE